MENIAAFLWALAVAAVAGIGIVAWILITHDDDEHDDISSGR